MSTPIGDRRSDDLLATLPCGVVSFTDEGVVQFANATLADLLQYDVSEIEGAHFEKLLTLAGRIFYQTHFFPLLRLHGRAEELFLLLRRKDGSDVGTLVNAVRRERDGRVVNDCVMLEVRERRKYEDELLRAKRAAEQANSALSLQAEELRALNQELTAQAEELERARQIADDANRSKSEFLAMMSHELRTPLNAIGGHVQLIDLGIYGTPTEGQRQALSRIDRNQRHLLRLINDILNLARIESGRLEYSITDFPVHQVLAEIAPMIEPQIAAKELQYSVRGGDDSTIVRADREKLQQILLNLLSNAVKFTPNGGSITVDISRPQQRAGIVFLRVIDTGAGVPADKIESIFEPFLQVDASHSHIGQGIGLGLAISRDLARGMGGDLRARSTVGEGSVFTLTLCAPSN